MDSRRKSAAMGWVAILRSDRTILHDGPLADTNRLERESLDLVAHLRASARRGNPAYVFLTEVRPNRDHAQVAVNRMTVSQPSS